MWWEEHYEKVTFKILGIFQLDLTSSNLFNHACTSHTLALTYSAKTCELIEQESYLTPSFKDVRNLSSFDLKNREVLGLNFSWCDITTGGGQGFLDDGIMAWEKSSSSNLLVFSYKINQVKICIFIAFDWPSSISGWQVMAKNHYIIN